MYAFDSTFVALGDQPGKVDHGLGQLKTTKPYAHLMGSPLRAGVDAVASVFRRRPTLVYDAQKRA